MEIKTTTIYDKDRLIRFNHFMSLQRKVFWLIMSIVTLGFVGYYIYFTMTYGFYVKMLFACSLIIVNDIVYIVLHIVMPYFTVKKSKSLNAEIEYIFYDEYFTVNASSVYENSESKMSYSVIKRALKRNNELYLISGNRRAFLVDLSTLTAEEANGLKEILSKYIELKKIKW